MNGIQVVVAILGMSITGAALAQISGEVDAAVAAWADAYNSHDPARVVARYHPEAAFWGTTSPTLRTTPEDVGEYFAGLARRPNAQVSIGAKTVRIVDSIAVVTGNYTFTDVANGAHVSRPSRFSFVLERTGNDWLIVQHHSSRMPAAPQVAFAEVPNWADFSGGPHPGNVSGVAVDNASGRVWIAARCGANECSGNTTDAPIIALDAESGRVLARFGAGVFVWPHGIHVDRDGNVWVADGRAADGRGMQVFKFSPDGRELMRLGRAGVSGSGPDAFSGPTDIAIADDGSIFVTDGHETDSNHRIMKFSPAGEFLLSFGEFGSEPGQFNVPHAIAIDSSGRLFVADRDNNRVQIFDSNGVFIDQWTQFGRPSGIAIGSDGAIYVSDNQSNAERNPGVERGIRIGDAATGVVRAFIPDPEFDPDRAQETSAHGLAVDANGNIYGAEVWGRIVRKYRSNE